MKTRKRVSQQTLDRLATLYEYADGDPMDGEEEMVIRTVPYSTAADDRQRAAESERLLGRMLRAHEGVPAGDG